MLFYFYFFKIILLELLFKIVCDDSFYIWENIFFFIISIREHKVWRNGGEITSQRGLFQTQIVRTFILNLVEIFYYLSLANTFLALYTLWSLSTTTKWKFDYKRWWKSARNCSSCSKRRNFSFYFLAGSLSLAHTVTGEAVNFSGSCYVSLSSFLMFFTLTSMKY